MSYHRIDKKMASVRCERCVHGEAWLDWSCIHGRNRYTGESRIRASSGCVSSSYSNRWLDSCSVDTGTSCCLRECGDVFVSWCCRRISCRRRHKRTVCRHDELFRERRVRCFAESIAGNIDSDSVSLALPGRSRQVSPSMSSSCSWIWTLSDNLRRNVGVLGSWHLHSCHFVLKI